jgi:hypothetical protein
MSSSRNYTFYLFIVTALVLLTFGVLHYMQVPAGTLIDWVVSIVAFWWFVGITTIPWNMYFSAKEVLIEAKLSSEKGIDISKVDLGYARKVALRFVWVAIALHLFSAALLFFLAYYKITVVGYLASAIALLLTLLRPLQRLYEHISLRLRQLSHQIMYPRQDVAELIKRVSDIEENLQTLNRFTDVDDDYSWTCKVGANIIKMQDHLQSISHALEEIDTQNKHEHEQLNKKTEEEIKRFSEDAQFLNQVRDIIHFFKKA